MNCDKSYESEEARKSLDSRFLFDSMLTEGNSLAIVIKNCIVRKNGSEGAAVRTVERGTLIQVWSNYVDVRFSIIIEDILKTDTDCLICKFNDIALVPNKLFGSLLPLNADERVSLVKDIGLAESLADVTENSPVEVLGPEKEIQCFGIVKKKDYVPNLKNGFYYGVQLVGSYEKCREVAKLTSLVSRNLPANVDTVLTIAQLRPTSKTLDEMNIHRTISMLPLIETQSRLPKSMSHQSLREETTTRRQASRSVDLSASAGKILNTEVDSTKPLSKVLDCELDGHPSRLQGSRSLDIPQASGKRLARGRACSSLDSDGTSHRNVEECIGSSDIGDDELGVGSMVEVLIDKQPYYGVIRWVGRLSENASRLMAGIEMEEELNDVYESDSRGLFHCSPPSKPLFVPLATCRKDGRFQDNPRRRPAPAPSSFGQIDCPTVEGVIPPISVELEELCGKNRGIQGHHNSCYLDATLFAMFAFTSVFDSLLYRPPFADDIPQYTEVQRVLRDEIVNPLRRNLYVRADRVMNLRTLLENLSSVTGLTSEEKDPEEFLNSLLAQILRADPFLQLSSGQEAFHYQLFVEKDERLSVPSVQQLLEQSFLASDIKLKRLPPCLIIQMPRFGKAFKMYSRILPPTVLDVTDVIDNSPRQCTVCGKLAEMECRECFMSGFEGWSFCVRCLETVHRNPSRVHHVPRKLAVPQEFRDLQEHSDVPRLLMHLFAVVCIETSHYVSFLKTDKGWVFFDSMADRKGEQNGYNIPEIVHCADLPFWLSKKGAQTLEEMRDERQLPELEKRLLCDAYMCMYQSQDIMMYR